MKNLGESDQQTLQYTLRVHLAGQNRRAVNPGDQVHSLPKQNSSVANRVGDNDILCTGAGDEIASVANENQQRGLGSK